MEYAEDVSSGEWLELPGSDVAGTGGEETVMDAEAGGTGARFYRVVEH